MSGRAVFFPADATNCSQQTAMLEARCISLHMTQNLWLQQMQTSTKCTSWWKERLLRFFCIMASSQKLVDIFGWVDNASRRHCCDAYARLSKSDDKGNDNMRLEGAYCCLCRVLLKRNHTHRSLEKKTIKSGAPLTRDEILSNTILRQDFAWMEILRDRARE